MYFIKIHDKTVKQYPFRLQCLTWLKLKGLIYYAKGQVWTDPVAKIEETNGT